MTDILHPILLLFVLAFWMVIVWAVIALVRALQRIAGSVEQLVRQNEHPKL